ncbi:beta-lactamase family protein [Ensifer sp. IC4062]|nr:serine hydrolase domain-containing protein [Ensifer sp. IC4062]MCA1441923.1 beta-lactamase family protein [Ensifer sp. IC4062]
MTISRRDLIKVGIAAGTASIVLATEKTAASGASEVTVRSNGASGHRYQSTFEKLVAYAKEEIAEFGLPGMTFCLVDADGFAAVGLLGWSDQDRQIPVHSSHLFQIGSISKSFAALCVHRLADEGKVDLDAPISRYLPDLPLPTEPILLRQLLSHTSGLPGWTQMFPRVPDGRHWTGFAPGTEWSYSDVAYDLLGVLVAKISGKPYPMALRDLVIAPLGISGLKEAIETNDRAKYAIGYSPLDFRADLPLGQAAWVNFDLGEGNVGATADSMTAYLQFLISVGRGRGAPVFSDAAAKRFSTPLEAAAMFGKGEAYASGLNVIDLDGRTAFHHTGAMLGFRSAMTVDPGSGVGCYVSVNARLAGWGPSNISKYACRLLRHVREAENFPEPTKPTALDPIEDAEDYAGTYVSAGEDGFQVVLRSDRMYIAADGHEGRVRRIGRYFQADHPRLGTHLFDFVRSGNAVKSAWHGGTLFGRGSVVPQLPVPPGLAALQGVYVSMDPFMTPVSVFAEGERLVFEQMGIYRQKDTLHPHGENWRPENSPCERFHFADTLNGVPQRLNFSGSDLWRFSRERDEQPTFSLPIEIAR